MAERTLPSYERPPVVEVVYSILFDRLDNLATSHIGLLWSLYKAEYPKFQELPPLAAVIEAFGDVPSSAQLELVQGAPLPRVWFVKQDESSIIQLQRDRFLQNWRKLTEKEAYPRFDTIFPNFQKNLHTFVDFLRQENLGDIRPLQYETTYVNHIPQGEGWKDLADIGSVFPDVSWRVGDRFLPPFEGLNWQTAFLMPNNSGRLHATIRRGVRTQDRRPTLMLELTARGIGAFASLERMPEWFQLAREWIVRGFADLTSKDIQENTWKRLT